MPQPDSRLVEHPDPLSGGGADLDGPVTARTAALLRAQAERMGEPFDGTLTEGQSLKRLAALEEIERDG